MSINEIDQLVLLAIARLGDEAYGVTIREEIVSRSGRTVSMAGVYVSLERLAERGLVETTISDPLPERGGRARKVFRVSRSGAQALLEQRTVFDRMWEGMEAHPDLRT